MFYAEWQKKTIDELVDEFKYLDAELDSRIAASKKSNPKDSTSPSERNQEIVELGMIIHALKLYIAEHRSAELASSVQSPNTVVTLSAEQITASLQEAVKHLKRGDYFSVIAQCKGILASDQDNIQAYFLRGLAFAKAGIDTQAIQDFSAVMRLSPNELEAYRQRAKAHSNLKDWNNVISDQSEVMRLDANDFKAYRERGIAYYSLGKYEEAIMDFDHCLALNRKDFYAYTFRSMAYLKLRNWSRALEDAQSAQRWTNLDLPNMLIKNIHNAQAANENDLNWVDKLTETIYRYMRRN